MKRRAENHNAFDTLLLELFLQELPLNSQCILVSLQDLTPIKAAKIGDKLLDITTSQVNDVSSTSSHHSNGDAELLKEIKFLREDVASLRF